MTGDALRRTVGYDVPGRLASYKDEQVTTQEEVICDDPMDLYTCYPVTSTNTTLVRQESYAYDAVGNRSGGDITTETGNRLTTMGGYTMTYDADGNLATKTGNGLSQSFTWNALGQLTAVTTNGATSTYGYDGLGRRVRKTVNGVTTYFLHDGDHLVMQLDGNGDPVLEFSYYPGVDRPHAVKRASDGARFYYTTQQPGHVTALVNTSNQVVNRYAYTPFGVALSTTEAVAQPFRFTGREFDSETGLYYYRARYYDPALARFISEDPIGLAGGVNLYAYVGNDPVNYTDPSGLEGEASGCAEWMLLLMPVDGDPDRTVGKLVCVRPTIGGGVQHLPGTVTTAPGNPGLPPGAMPSNPGFPMGGGGGSNPGADVTSYPAHSVMQMELIFWEALQLTRWVGGRWLVQ